VKKKTIIFIVLFVALAARLYGLGHESLWTDELSTIYRSGHESVADVIRRGTISDWHPPGYYLFMHFWMMVFGDSEVSVRMPSAIAGTISIYFIYVVGRKLYDEKTGIMSSLAAAFSAYHLYYSQEARMYAFLLLFTLICASFMLNITGRLRKGREPKNRDIILYSVFAVLAIYTHYFGLLAVGLSFIYMLSVSKYRIRKLVYAGTAIFLCYLPWLPHFQHDASRTEIWIPHVTLWAGYNVLISFFQSPVILLISVMLFAYLWKSRSDTIVSAWLLLPLLVACIVSFRLAVVAPHVLIISFPAAMFMIGKGARSRYGFILIILIAVHTLFIYNYYGTQKEQYRDAAHIVSGNWNGEPVVLQISNAFYFEYYSNATVSYLVKEPGDIFGLVTFLEPVNDTVWYVEMHNHNVNADKAFEVEGFEEQENWEFIGGFVKKYIPTSQ